MDEEFQTIEGADLQSIRELNIISKLSQSIITTLDFEKVLQIISDGMSELLEIESAAIYLLENEEELLLSATTPPLDPGMPDFLRKAKVSDHPYIQDTILGRKPILVADTKIAQLSSAERKVIEMRGLRTLLYLPFVQENSILGVLILGTCNKSKLFSEHQIELGQTVANQLSVAIQNSRLHIDLKNHKDNLEKLVKERTQELQATLDHLKSVKIKLIQSEKMASLGVLTAGVAHEINNPLNFIMGAYNGLESFFNETAPEYKEQVELLLDSIKIGIHRASDIIQGLNQFSRMSSTLNETCEIHSIIDNCLVILHNRYKKHIQIKKQYEDKDLIILGNSGKLHQAFTNILTNSIQAIEGAGTISITTQKNVENILISFTDTGYGIKKENLGKITDPFFTTKEPSKGTGLGLSITYNIIQEHEGQLLFESKVNKGTTVKIILPINKK